ncbi:MAG: HAMP domain-containing protein [Desulfomonile tiedjei]|uniref:HAMP domain-containing protein n=1 Tax=Desulfomonile tiedjei TaxID=2358 RepID=A0A9D6UZS8_9BACT|nr:HAMP domain-containing protein [Desulfomonile tiedjei]
MISLRRSITLKIIFLVLGSTCIVLSLVIELMYSSSKKLIRAEAETNAVHLVSSLANHVEQEFILAAHSADQLASFLGTSAWTERPLLDHIRRMVGQNHSVFGSAVAFLPFGFSPEIERYAPYFYRSDEQIHFVQLANESYNYFEKDWYRIPATERKSIWTEPYFDDGGGNVAMTTYARPMSGEDTGGTPAKLKAIVTADISLESLNKLVNEKAIYSTGFCFVISKKGTLVTSRYPERVMKQSIFDVADDSKHPGASAIAQAMLTEPSGFHDIGPGFTGVDSYLAFTRMDPPGWTLAAILPKHELFAKVDALRHETLLLAALGIVLLAVAAILVARSISRPVRQMAGETFKVAEGNYDIDLSSIRSIDEVGQLARSFTRMTEGLKERERIKDTFGRYLTQEVVKRLLESKDGLKLGGEIREISIMMSDLRGFTALSSSMSPEQIIKFLNRYLGRMVEIILDHRGIIDEIIGDGILAFFGAPESLNNHPELAVACALKMQLAMEEINTQNEADGLPHLEMGVAVNTGEVVVGNIGSEKRAKYGAVGAQVNFTGRVEAFTVGGQVLISRSTREKLSDKLEIGNALNVGMKGVPGKVELYDVRGIRGDYEAHLEHRDESLQRLVTGIPARVFGMDQKILDSTGKQATITGVSLKSARLILWDEILQWDDVRLLIKNEDAAGEDFEIYGKVMTVGRLDDGLEALVRFTSVSPGAYKLLRQLLAPS